MYKPEQKNARLLHLVVVGFALVAVAAYFVSLSVDHFRWIFQTVIILSATAALYLWSRYSLMWFAYMVRQQESEDGGEELVVYKGQGRKEGTMEAVLPLDSILERVPIRRGEPVGAKDPQKNWKLYAKFRYRECDCYDYTKTFLWSEATLYIFYYGGRHIALLMEADNL